MYIRFTYIFCNWYDSNRCLKLTQFRLSCSLLFLTFSILSEQCEDSSKETSEQDDVPDSLESDGEIEDDTTEEKEEVAKEKEEDKMEVPEKEAAIENDVPEGDVPVAPAPEDDTVELTSNQFENELFGEEEKAAQGKLCNIG